MRVLKQEWRRLFGWRPVRSRPVHRMRACAALAASFILLDPLDWMLLAANFILLQLVVAAMLEFLKDPVRFVYV